MSLGQMSGPHLPFQSRPLFSGLNNLSIDAPGTITIAGQTVALAIVIPSVLIGKPVRPVGPALPFQAFPRSAASGSLQLDAGSISLDGQSLTFTIGYVLALDGGTLTVAGQDVTLAATAANLGQGRVYGGPGPYFEFTPALRAYVLPTNAIIQTAGAIGISGQSITVATAVSMGTGSVVYQGQDANLTIGTVATVTPSTLDISGQSVALDGPILLVLTIEGSGGISIAGQQDIDIFPPPLVEGGSGGWAFLVEYERQQRQRAAARRRRKELEEEVAQIEDPVEREIAQILHEQEAKEERRKDLERLRKLAKEKSEIARAREYSDRVAKAYEELLEHQNLAAAKELERQLRIAAEEEDFLIQAAKIILRMH